MLAENPLHGMKNKKLLFWAPIHAAKNKMSQLKASIPNFIQKIK